METRWGVALLGTTTGLMAVVLQLAEGFLFVRGLKLSGRWAVGVWLLFLAANLPLPYILWLIGTGRQPGTLAAALVVRPCYAWHFNWLCFLLFVAPLVWGSRAAAALLGSEIIFQVMRAAVLALAGGWGILTCVGLVNTLLLPEVKTVEIKVPGLPGELDHLKIAHLSDPHIAWWNSRPEFQRIANLIARQNPDLLVVTGDMVDHNPEYVEVFADCLEGVKPRLGRYAVIGNHDVYTGAEAVAHRLQARGFRLLRSECVNLKEKGAPLNLAGYDDSGKSWTSGDPAENKIPAAIASCDLSLPVILLAHRPPRFSKIENSPVFLALAGHTHGGQFRLPFGGPGLADLTFEHSAGLFSHKGKFLYVTRGTGTVGWPFRLFCPPEITFIILRAERPPAREL